MEIQFENIKLDVRESKEHEWILETSMVASGYGVSESTLRSAKSRNEDELIEGKHFVTVANCNANPRFGIPHQQTFWTKRGVARLGFFIKSERAKRFRDWAEDLIIAKMSAPADLSKLEILKLATESEEERLRLEAENIQILSQLTAATEEIEANKPKVIFAEAVSNTNSEILVRDLAKLFSQNGVNVGQNRLFDWLVEKKYLERRQRWSKSKNRYDNDYWPTQKASDLQIFRTSQVVVNPSNGISFKKNTVHVTGKGETYLIGKYIKDNSLQFTRL